MKKGRLNRKTRFAIRGLKRPCFLGMIATIAKQIAKLGPVFMRVSKGCCDHLRSFCDFQAMATVDRKKKSPDIRGTLFAIADCPLLLRQN